MMLDGLEELRSGRNAWHSSWVQFLGQLAAAETGSRQPAGGFVRGHAH